MKKRRNKLRDLRKRESKKDDWFSRLMATEPDYETVFYEIQRKFGYMGIIELRMTCVRLFAWAVPDRKAVEMIARYSPITEIGAGGGYWAYRIAQLGADIAALDAKVLRVPIEGYTWDDMHVRTYFDVETCDPDATAPPDRTLFVCYPEYDSDMAVNCLRRYEGQTFIYVGEWADGNCANAEFFDELAARWEVVHTHALPYFYEYTSCDLRVFRRKMG